MKGYKIKITETLERIVTVEAETVDEAKAQVQEEWENSIHILDSEDFTGVEFESAETEEEFSVIQEDAMKETLKEALWNKLTAEYKSYQVSILSLSNSEIYGKCYEIDCMVNFYEILMEKAESMLEDTLSALLNKDHLLLSCYDEWLARDDINYSEMETHIAVEVEYFVSEANKQNAAIISRNPE